MKKLFEDLNVFKKDCRVKQEVGDGIQSFFFKDDPQNSIENNMFCKGKKR